jgi:siroheme synthase (precorrin-2 oxidase/ferrochelatase)
LYQKVRTFPESAYFSSLLIISIMLSLTQTEIIMYLEFKNQQALVIGGNSGIGLEVAKILLNQGAIVTIVGRNVSKLGNPILAIAIRLINLQIALLMSCLKFAISSIRQECFHQNHS